MREGIPTISLQATLPGGTLTYQHLQDWHVANLTAENALLTERLNRATVLLQRVQFWFDTYDFSDTDIGIDVDDFMKEPV